MKHHLSLAFLIAIFLYLPSKAQDLSLVTPSPEAAATIQYGTVPMNAHTGLPSLSLPLYTIKSGNYELPISLTYQSGGVKVDQRASNVGLGWMLQAGGYITKEVRDKPDEFFNRYPTPISDMGYLTTYGSDYLPSCSPNLQDDLSYNILMSLSHLLPDLTGNPSPQVYDNNPDVHYLNLPNGSSHTFVLDSDRVPHLLSQEVPLNIEKKPGQSGHYTVTDPQGITYFYETTVGKRTNPILDHFDWLIEMIKLTKVVTALGDEITFEYSHHPYSYPNKVSNMEYTKVAGYLSAPTYNPTPTTTIIGAQQLDRIDFPEGYVLFNYDQPREDLPGTSALTEMTIFNTNNKKIMKYDMEYDYFSNGVPGPENKRLQLKKVHKEGEGPYAFSYNPYNGVEDYLPSIYTYSNDPFGYFGDDCPNGLFEVSYGETLIAGCTPSENLEKKRAGTLNKITYPTGGFTEFYYNENEYNLTYEDVVTEETSSSAFTELGNHDFPLPEDDNNQYEVLFINGCPGDSNEIDLQELPEAGGFCFFTLRDPEGTVVRSGSAGGRFQVNLAGAPAGNYTFQLEGIENQACGCSVQLLGTVATTETRIAPIRYSDMLRLDRLVVKADEQSPPMITTYNYEDPTTGLLSKEIYLPKRDYLRIKHNVQSGISNRYGRYIVQSDSPVETIKSSGYEYVEEHKPGQGFIRSRFVTGIGVRKNQPTLYINELSPKAGKMITKEIYDNDGQLQKRNTYSYEMDYAKNQESNDYDPSQPGVLMSGMSVGSYGSARVEECILETTLLYNFFDVNFYPVVGGWPKLVKTKGEYFIYNSEGVFTGVVTDSTVHEYGNPLHQQTTKTVSSLRDGGHLETITHYPLDVDAQDALPGEVLSLPSYVTINKLRASKRLMDPVQVTLSKIDPQGESQLLSITRTNYKEWLFPNQEGQILPISTENAKGNGALKTELTYDDYDAQGNPLQIRQKGLEVPVSYVWGYNNTKLIAELKGVSYSDIDESRLEQLQELSSLDIDPASEQALKYELDLLRDDHPEALITTFTHDPLIGVTSITDPRSKVSCFIYDDENRLKEIRDQSGNLLESFSYHHAFDEQGD